MDKHNITNNLSDIPSTVAMIPAFYTSNTLLVKNCLDFSTYNCEDYGCTIYEKSPIQVDYLNFQAEGYLTRAKVYLDYDNWSLYSLAVFADHCWTDGDYSVGTDTYGILGLGIEPGFDKNFIGSQVFTVYIEPNGKSGKLLFNWNLDYVISDIPLITLATDTNWQRHNVFFYGVGSQQFLTSSYSLVFDLNIEEIQIPSHLYYLLTFYLRARYNVDCTPPEEPLPVCTINEQIKNLPNISIFPVNGEITLPPQLYVKEGFNDSVLVENITLNFKITSDEGSLSPVSKAYNPWK